MTWSFRSVLLTLLMLWQALLVLSPAYVADRVVNLNHLVEHSEALQHHHHDDASLHADASEPSTDHTHPDAGFNTTALVTLAWPTVWEAQPMPPRALVLAAMPYPHPDGPLRPPRQRA